MKAFEELVTLDELKKYLKVYSLSENNYDKREFALELLLKLERGTRRIEVPVPQFGAAQSQESVPSVGQS